MGEARWKSLTDAQRALLERGIEVWENALASEIITAERAGEVAGHQQGVQFFDMSAADQHRFNEIYERDAERRAQQLAHYGIDAMASFRRARALATGMSADGNVQCEKGKDGKTA